jgi:hypothetical protein
MAPTPLLTFIDAGLTVLPPPTSPWACCLGIILHGAAYRLAPALLHTPIRTIVIATQSVQILVTGEVQPTTTLSTD